MSRPKIFIGSSVEGLTIAYAVQQNLTHDAEITVWDQGVFELSQTTIESLVAVLEKSDFAIFVFSPDDILKIRKKEFLSVRDNVIFELGLFIGKLGRHRSFIVMPDKPLFHIPTDLLGVNAGKYDTSRTDGSFQAATGPVSHQIRTQIKKMGLLLDTLSEAVSQKEASDDVITENQKETNWGSLFFDKKYEAALELLNKEIDETTEELKKKELIIWKIYVEYNIDSKKGRSLILEKIKDEPEDKFSYTTISKFLLWENELTLAHKIISEGLAKFKNDDVLIYRKSEYLEKIGKTDEAIELLLNLKYQDDEVLVTRLAELYESLEVKKMDEAFNVIKKAYNANPTSEQLSFKLARLAQETEKNEIALHLLDRLIKEFPKNVSYLGYLGNSCVSLGLLNKAMILYKKAEELSQAKESWIIENIGNILNFKGFYSEARKYFDKALEIESDSEYSFDKKSSIIKNEEKENEKYSKILKDGLNLLLTD
jgi:tetratricopeptide (TPR) repeat protein